MDERARGEIGHTVRRVVDKLLHAPTVRVKELAAAPGGDSYADALRELFDLDPKAPEAVARADMSEDEPAAAAPWNASAPAVDAECAEADCVSTPSPPEGARGTGPDAVRMDGVSMDDVSVQDVNAHRLEGVNAETVNAQTASVRAVSARGAVAAREGETT
jgi:glutamyl-tRNA reductase